jgi:hypothetical protein
MLEIFHDPRPGSNHVLALRFTGGLRIDGLPCAGW